MPSLKRVGVDARHRAVDVALVEQPALQRLAQVLEGLAALQVAAALDGQRRALGRDRR